MSAMSGKKVALIVGTVLVLYGGSYLALRPLAVGGQYDLPFTEWDLHIIQPWTFGRPVSKPESDSFRAVAEVFYSPLLRIDNLVNDEVGFAGKRSVYMSAGRMVIRRKLPMQTKLPAKTP
ncbi:MAG: hypothetical protein HRU46_09870 [Verrucomicrobiales bacterium]|nr:hypothetical protein [Verrucomicrobiales bacterium]